MASGPIYILLMWGSGRSLIPLVDLIWNCRLGIFVENA